MKILLFEREIQLSDWVTDDDHKHNYVRYLKDSTTNFIGLNCMWSSNVNYYLLKDNKIDLDSLTWIVFSNGIFKDVAFIYNEIYKHPKYSVSELPFVKNNIDKFLLKFNNMKVFL